MANPRPSAMPALHACPCFDSKDEAGEAAERGTLGHKALESVLKNGPTKDQDLAALTADEADGVAWAADYIQNWCKNLSAPMESEVKLQYFASEGDWEPLYEGTGDVVCSTNLFDYKSGDPHDYEFQMYAYALCMFQRAKARGTPFVGVLCHLMFSRVQSVIKFHINEAAAEKAIKEILARRDDPKRKPKANDFCKWCMHAPICPELNQLAIVVAEKREDFQLETFHASEIVNPDHMAKALRLARFLAAWCEGVEHHAKQMAIKGGRLLPGFVISKRAGNRYIKDLPMALGLCKDLVSQDEFLKCCNAKIGDLEKLLGKKRFAEVMKDVTGRMGDNYFLTAEEKQIKEISGDAVEVAGSANQPSAQAQSAIPVSTQPVAADSDW